MPDASLIRFVRPPWRAALLWLLALVVPLQCSAAVVRLSAGPSHVHLGVGATAAPTELRDFRRDLGGMVHAAPSLPSLPTLPTLPGVLHGHGHAERHHHPGADAAGTVASDAALARIDSRDDGAAGASAAFAALVPLLGTGAAWQASAGANVPPVSLQWSASSRVAATPERPPRGLPASA